MSLPTGTGYITTEELFRQHAGFVTRFLACCGVPAEHIEDAVQEVFLVVHRNGGYRPGIAKPTSYLGNIAFYAASKHRSRELIDRKRRSESAIEQMASETASPAREAQVQQDLRRLRLALDRLPDDLRTTLLLVELEGESCLSVAAASGCTVGTVYWRLHQARKKLRSALKFVDAERMQPRRKPAPVTGLGKRPLPSLEVIVFFCGKSSFKKSEAGRLLDLAGKQLTPSIELSQLIATHQQLVQAGRELPSWAAHCLPHATSLASVIGVGSIGAGVAMGSAAIVAIAMLILDPMLLEPSTSFLQRTPSPTNAHSAGVIQPTVVTLPQKQMFHTSPTEPRGETLKEKRLMRVEPKTTRASRPRGNAVRVEATAPSLTTTPLRLLNTMRELQSGPLRTDRPRLNAVLESRSIQADEELVVTDPLVPNKAIEPSAPSPSPQNQRKTEETSHQLGPPDPKLSTEPQQVAAAPPDDPFVLEMHAVTNAERLLSTEPARALTIIRKLQSQFPSGYFGEERAYVEVIALLNLGRIREGRAKADKFLLAYPAGPYSQRVGNAAISRDANR